MEDTIKFLNENNIDSDIVQKFIDNKITLELAKDLNENHLKEICPQIGARIRLKNILDSYVDSHADTSSFSSGLLDSGNVDDNLEDITLTLFKSRAEFPDFDLKTLLTTTPLGKTILSHYENFGMLDKKTRTILTDIIIRHLFTRIVNCHITHEEYNVLAAKIVSLFPTESVGTYFVKPIKKADSRTGKPVFARGKLVDKVRNLLYASGERKRSSSASQSCASRSSIKISDIQDDCEVQLNYLKMNDEPWDEVKKIWEDTFVVRRQMKCLTVHEFIEKFKILRDLRCEPLINYDFEELYPNKSLMVYKQWAGFFNKILILKKKDIIDPQCLSYIEILQSMDDDDQKLPLQLIVFGYLIPPKGRLNRKVKFSTIESIEGLIAHVECTGDIEKKISDLKDKARLRKQTVQPYILIEGQLSCWTTAYVIIDTIRYQFSSAYKALDILFKIYQVFNVCYPPVSEHLYLILQRKVYGISTEHDCIPPYIYEILAL